MKAQLKPIRPKRVSDQVFDQLRELIFRGDIRPGDKIMPERELSEALNVSRTSVRDAIQKLVVMGFLEQKQGQGTFVKSPEVMGKSLLGEAMEAHDATLVDLLEVRLGIECNAARLAARRGTREDFDFLKKAIADMAAELKQGQLGNISDVSFHMTIAYATKNPVQVFFMKSFLDFLSLSVRENLRFLYEHPGNTDEIMAQHARIAETIINRQPDEAFEAMREHIQYVIDFFRDLQRESGAVY